MLTIERHNFILELLSLKSNISNQEFLEKLDISESTLRRDLNILEKQSKIKRVHGGAMLIESKKRVVLEDDDILSRSNISFEEKDKIAKTAANFVKDGSSIYLDAGTTTFQMIKYLKEKKIKVVTNGLSLIQELEKYNLESYLLGGKIKSKTSCTVGYLAVESLNNYRFDSVFLGANAFDLKGYSTPDPEEACVKNAAVKLGEFVYFLCDSSKIKKNSFINFAKLNSGTLIIDKAPPKEYFNLAKIEVTK
ncbi:DeoR/GlpR transcriptional regulator [Cetobacterium sp. 2A]|uniref:DeoR/GlpR family DNA-binding transcription regulator n=1 Tax=unclassified Cetobacterium TaxID=2630983 RepID=UPI00163B7341|nr:DeoR/GlpR family DNA-binding transcription regulator [Cetobacterium sp. 2A]MBC2855516.1 DeoR/GlpR transcriptional regulator [Cetobacterium sp. 2A]